MAVSGSCSDVADQLHRLAIFSSPKRIACKSNSLHTNFYRENETAGVSSLGSSTFFCGTGEDSERLQTTPEISSSLHQPWMHAQHGQFCHPSSRHVPSLVYQQQGGRFQRRTMLCRQRRDLCLSKQTLPSGMREDLRSPDALCRAPEVICFRQWTTSCAVEQCRRSEFESNNCSCLVCQHQCNPQHCTVSGQPSLRKRRRGSDFPRPTINFSKMTRSSVFYSLEDARSPPNSFSSPSKGASFVFNLSPVRLIGTASQPQVERSMGFDLDLDAIERN